MKPFSKSLAVLFLTVLTAPAAHAASDLMIASTMQRCTANEDCQLVTNSCADNCGFVPINKTNLPAIQQMYQTRCAKPMESNPTCHMNPPISAVCINSRCTIDYAYANNAGPKDYQSGAYPVSETPSPDKVKGDYSHVNDRKNGFTAYDLPQDEVKQKSVGEIVDKVYVPPQAPVTGGNYVPVTPGTAPVAPPPQAAPAAPVPPAPAPYVPAPVAPVPAPQAAAPAIPRAAVPTGSTYSTVPVMTPTKPNQMVNQNVAPALPAGEYVPPPTTPTIPAPGLPAAPVAVAPSPAVPSVGATGVPQAPAGSVPIPPSDLQPPPTFVPPPGGTSPVSSEDPGAPPPEGTVMRMEKGPDGSPGATIGITKPKSFGTTTTTTKTTVYQTNQ